MSNSKELYFDGETYEPKHDKVRLGKLTRLVFDVMRDERWRTLAELRTATEHGSEASLSARLRDLRKDRFGGHAVERRRRGLETKGLFEYRLVVKANGLRAAKQQSLL